MVGLIALDRAINDEKKSAARAVGHLRAGGRGEHSGLFKYSVDGGIYSGISRATFRLTEKKTQGMRQEIVGAPAIVGNGCIYCLAGLACLRMQTEILIREQRTAGTGSVSCEWRCQINGV